MLSLHNPTYSLPTMYPHAQPEHYQCLTKRRTASKFKEKYKTWSLNVTRKVVPNWSSKLWLRA